MTNPDVSDIFNAERKSGPIRSPRKGIQMNTTMILSYLKRERYEEALDSKQGLVSVHAFLRERNHMFQERIGMDMKLS